MKQLFISFLFLLFFFTAFSQSNKIYFTAEGKFVRDPFKADYYLIVEKLQDSAYLSEQYDMSNHLLKKGTYKDDILTKPNGKFFYYQNHLSFRRINDEVKVDTNVVLKTSGYYINGLKAGAWVQYDIDGNKESISIYENDKLNGTFKQFDITGAVIQSGSFINDKKEGEWNNYQPGVELPASIDTYLHDKLIMKDNHFIAAQPGKTFFDYMNKTTGKYLNFLANGKIILGITVDGKIEKVTIYADIDPLIKDKIIAAFLSAPQFTPALYDNKPIKSQSVIDFKTKVSTVTTVHPISPGRLVSVPLNGSSNMSPQRIP